MTDPLDTLRPEVREAVEYMDRGGVARIAAGGWRIIRAELLRLARNDADARIALDADHDWKEMYERAKKAEAELAALKARIAGSHLVIADGHCGILWPVGQAAFDQPKGKRVRLLVDEPAPPMEPGSLDELRIERGGGNHG